MGHPDYSRDLLEGAGGVYTKKTYLYIYIYLCVCHVRGI